MQGFILEVSIKRLGNELDVATAAGTTVLTLEDVSDFLEPATGFLVINDVEYSYSAPDETTNQITVTPGLAAAADAGERVWYSPATYEKWALVEVEDRSEPISALVGGDTYDRITDGVREPEDQEEVLLELDETGTWIVTTILNQEPVTDMSFADPETIPEAPPPAPVAPIVSPTPTVTGMKAAIAVRWDGIDNPTAVEYQLHMYEVPGTIPVFDDPATKVGPNTAGNMAVVSRTADGLLMEYGPDNARKLYYFRLFAFNDAGVAPVSAEVSGSMDKTAVGDLVADAILTQLLTALNVNAQQLVIGSDTGRRIVLDILSGFNIYAQDGTPLVVMPTNEADEISIRAKATLTTLDVLSTLTLYGPGHHIAGGGVLNLDNGVADPSQKPTPVMTVEQKSFEKPSGDGEMYGFAHNPSINRYYSCWVPDDGDAAPQMIVWDSNGVILFAFNLSKTWRPKGGCVYHPTNGFLVLFVTDDDAAYCYEVRNLDGTLLRRDNVNGLFNYSKSYKPCIGWDYVNSRVLRCSYAGGTQYKAYIYGDSISAAGVPTYVQSSHTTAVDSSARLEHDMGCVIRVPNAAPFDLGADRFILHGRNNTGDPFTVWDPTTASAMTRDSGRGWMSDTNWVAGFCWNSTKAMFESITASAYRKTWQGGGSYWTTGGVTETQYASTTFKDTDAGGTGTHETKASPETQFEFYKRWQLQVTSTPPPDYGGVDDPDKTMLYIRRPTGTNHLQGPGNTTGAFTIKTLDSAGAASPATNNFPATSPGIVKNPTNAAGVVDIRGSGYARVDWLAPIGELVELTYPVTAGSEPYGLLLADGREVDAALYPFLTAKWGSGTTQTTWGPASVAGKLKLPDFIDRFAVGAGTGAGTSVIVGATEGEAQGAARYNRQGHDHSHTIPQSADHSHAGPQHDHGAGSLASNSASNTTITGGGNRALNPITGTTGTGGTAQTGSNGAHDHTGTTGNKNVGGHSRAGVAICVRAG